MKTVDDVVKKIENEFISEFCNDHKDGSEIIIKFIKEKFKQEIVSLFDELEKEFENHYWNSVQRDKEIILLHIKQKFAEMRG